ncbi:Trypsin [compost metagenome]
MFISNSAIRINNGIATITSKTLENEMRVCSSEPYAQQPAVGNCSGSLVGEDLIATAGHCVGASDCRGYSVVFGYRMQNSTTAVLSVPESEVYGCKTVVAREYTNNQDYALVQLDRKVTNHRPLTLAKTPVGAGDEIYVIGHPSGLPTKIADGARVRSLASGFFRTNLDTYGGNSGSAVFSAETNEVVGILVRGESDFKYANNNQCRVSNVCAEDGCRGEDVTNISYINKAMELVK